MNPGEILKEANKTPHLRRGQAIFNALTILDPEAAETIRGDVDADPFYNDNNLARFWAKLAEMREAA